MPFEIWICYKEIIEPRILGNISIIRVIFVNIQEDSDNFKIDYQIQIGKYLKNYNYN